MEPDNSDVDDTEVVPPVDDADGVTDDDTDDAALPADATTTPTVDDPPISNSQDPSPVASPENTPETLPPAPAATTAPPATPVTSDIAPAPEPPPQQPSWKAEEAAFLRSVEPEAVAKEETHHAAKLDQIVAFARTRKSFKREDIRLLLSLPRRTADTYLSELVASGRLIHIGPKSHGRYEVAG
jgi:hypothetical protein